MAASNPVLDRGIATPGRPAAGRRLRLPTLRLPRPDDHQRVAKQEPEDGMSAFLVTLSILMLGLAAFIGGLWVAAERGTTPVHQAVFDRWWFFPVGLLLGTFGLATALYHRGRRRSVVVIGTLSAAGLVGLLVYSPYL